MTNMPIPNATTISNNELFLLASTASQDEDPLSFLNLDVPLPGIYDWNFGDSDLNFFEPLNTNVGNGAVPDFGASSWFDANTGLDLTNGATSMPNKTPGDPGTGGTESESIHGQPHEIPDGQPDDSPWVSSRSPVTQLLLTSTAAHIQAKDAGCQRQPSHSVLVGSTTSRASR
jgi:hypothetical protein